MSKVKAATVTMMTALEGVAKTLPEQDLVNEAFINHFWYLKKVTEKQARKISFLQGAWFTSTLILGFTAAEVSDLKKEIRKLKEAQKGS